MCLCEQNAPESLELHIPQLLCPVCQLWQTVRLLAAVGEPLFPGWAGRKVLPEFGALAGTRNWPRNDKLGTHSFRGGAARASREAKGSFSQLLRSGRWHSSAYQLYLDLSQKEAAAMASVLAGGSDDE